LQVDVEAVTNQEKVSRIEKSCFCRPAYSIRLVLGLVKDAVERRGEVPHRRSRSCVVEEDVRGEEDPGATISSCLLRGPCLGGGQQPLRRAARARR
jgi:hypothetical protein